MATTIKCNGVSDAKNLPVFLDIDRTIVFLMASRGIIILLVAISVPVPTTHVAIAGTLIYAIHAVRIM